VTGRPRILVFNGCYHGAVDETFVALKDGKPANKPGLAGEFRDLTRAAAVVEFNDLPALERALAAGDVACVVAEPVMTNSAMVLPEPGFHSGLRERTRRHGALLLIDETHTISTALAAIRAGMGSTRTCLCSASPWPAACRPPSGA
jgi:glutamate-1-semialdehyde 2,1-aminomutase